MSSSLTLDINGRTVIVRRMKWKAGIKFFKQLSEAVRDLRDGAAPDAQLFEILMPKLPSIVATSSDLITLLVCGSTDLNADELDALDPTAVLALLKAAMEINFDARFKDSVGALGDAIGSAFKVMTGT